ncbi:hypothetical protein [Dactylosporangium sp. NPDC000521]|uniref:hypothetical protein n=1 Tax=Dactylosporangium sp. NPDC000521 TaxID=3363975 RepID=UPI0036B48D6A
MRSLKTWWRIAAVVGMSLIMALLDHFVFDKPFAASLFEGLGIFGGIIVFRYLFDPPKRAQLKITTEQQSPKVEEQDALGG